MRKCLVVSALTASTLLFRVAAAEPPAADPPGGVDQARTHFLRGAELYKEANYDGALAEFSRAYQLVPNYRVLYNIAQAQVERHDYVAARNAFQDYLRQGATDVPEDRREEVQREIANLSTRISELTVTSNVTGGSVTVDGVTVGTLPLETPLLVSAGTRRVAVSKPGYATVERVISVTGGDKPELALQLEPIVSTTQAPPTPVQAEQKRRGPGAGAWLSLAATGAFAAGAVTFGLLTQDKDSDLDAQLARHPADRGRVSDTRSQLKLYAGLTDGFAAASAVSAVLAVYFFVSGSSSSEEAPRPKAARVVPFGNGIAVTGNF